MPTKYSKEVATFIADNVNGRTAKQLMEMTNAQFGTCFTESGMKSYKCNHKLRSETPRGSTKGTASKIFPAHIRDFIVSRHSGVGPTEMTRLLNKTFGTSYRVSQVDGYYSNHSLCSGLSGRFEKGSIPPNKGKKGVCHPECEKTWFKKGNTPKNQMPIGTEVLKEDGYLWRKIAEPNVWKQVHRILWEETNGPIPPKGIVTFLNRDTQDIRLDNLTLITQAESLEMTRHGLRSTDPQLTTTGVLIARVRTTARKRQKRNRRQ